MRFATMALLCLAIAGCQTTISSQGTGNSSGVALATVGRPGGFVLRPPSSEDDYQLGALYYVPREYESNSSGSLTLDDLCLIVPGHGLQDIKPREDTLIDSTISISKDDGVGLGAIIGSFNLGLDATRVQSLTLTLKNVKYRALNVPQRQKIRQTILGGRHCQQVLPSVAKNKKYQLVGMVSADVDSVSALDRGGTITAGAPEINGAPQGSAHVKRKYDVSASGKRIVFKVYADVI